MEADLAEDEDSLHVEYTLKVDSSCDHSWLCGWVIENFAPKHVWLVTSGNLKVI